MSRREEERRKGEEKREDRGEDTPGSRDRKQREEQTNISAWEERMRGRADREQKHCPNQKKNKNN